MYSLCAISLRLQCIEIESRRARCVFGMYEGIISMVDNDLRTKCEIARQEHRRIRGLDRGPVKTILYLLVRLTSQSDPDARSEGRDRVDLGTPRAGGYRLGRWKAVSLLEAWPKTLTLRCL